jgi:hypothetical protein
MRKHCMEPLQKEQLKQGDLDPSEVLPRSSWLILGGRCVASQKQTVSSELTSCNLPEF